MNDMYIIFLNSLYEEFSPAIIETPELLKFVINSNHPYKSEKLNIYYFPCIVQVSSIF